MTGSTARRWEYPLRLGDTLAPAGPLTVEGLLTSRFVAYCLRDGETSRAILGTAALLWAESLRQDPAGTLPDDDVELAFLARFGADLASWQAVRGKVLQGWNPRQFWDGQEFRLRLYHPQIAVRPQPWEAPR
jgi:hypothetical protein